MDVAAYKEFLNQPWGKLYYEILFAQLAHIKNKKILDFGSGFGLVADFVGTKQSGNSYRTKWRDDCRTSAEFPLSATTRQSRNVERYSKCSF